MTATALLATLHGDGAGLLSLLLYVLLAIVVLGVIFWVASQVLPPPWPGVIVAVLALIILIYLVA